jgi:hypothetical protein
VGGPLDFLKTEQELIDIKITKAGSSNLMKPAKLHFLGKKTKIGPFKRFTLTFLLKKPLNKDDLIPFLTRTE